MSSTEMVVKIAELTSGAATHIREFNKQAQESSPNNPRKKISLEENNSIMLAINFCVHFPNENKTAVQRQKKKQENIC